MSAGLTDIQLALLLFIRAQVLVNQRPPTMKEIGTHFGWTSLATVNGHLLALQRKGKIEADPGSKRYRVAGAQLQWVEGT